MCLKGSEKHKGGFFASEGAPNYWHVWKPGFDGKI